MIRIWTPKTMLLIFEYVYLAAMGFIAVYSLVNVRDLAEDNRQNAIIAEAQHCVDLHIFANQTRAGINVTPEALIEISADNPDTDPARVEAFLDSIERRVDAAITIPTCDRGEAQKILDEHARNDGD